jgi:predicted ester cyclase
MNGRAEAPLPEDSMSRSDRICKKLTTATLTGLAVVSLVTSCAPRPGASWREENLPQPRSTTVDDSVSAPRARGAVRAAQLYYAFWDTGKPAYVRAAVGPGFVDNTLPAGCRRGPEGLEAASRAFRAAVPDLRCTIEHLLVSDDQVVARLTFRGAHMGAFLGYPATGKPIEFSAIDLLRVEGGRVVEVAHVEDSYNSTLMRQLGAVPPAGQCRENP